MAHISDGSITDHEVERHFVLIFFMMSIHNLGNKAGSYSPFQNEIDIRIVSITEFLMMVILFCLELDKNLTRDETQR